MDSARHTQDRSLWASIYIKGLFFLYILLSMAALIFLALPRLGVTFFDPLKLWLRIAYGYWTAVSFILAQVGLGGGFFRLRFMKKLKLSKLSQLLFSFGTGFYISNFLLFILAFFHLNNQSLLRVYIIIAIPAVFFGLRNLRAAYLTQMKQRKSIITERKKISAAKAMVPLIIFLVWLSPLFIQSILPNSDWDGASFHLPQAKRFLNGEIADSDPVFYFYNFPSAINLIYGFFLAVKAEFAVLPLNLMVSGLLILAVFSIARQLADKKAALVAAFIFAGVNLSWEVALTPRIDVFLAVFIVLACYAFLLWIPDRRQAGFIIVMGAMSGTALGIKYTALFIIPILFLSVLLLCAIDYRKKLKVTMIPLIISIVFVLVPSGWWYARNFVSFGDPIYPFLSGPLFSDNQGDLRDFESAMDHLLEEMPSDREVENELIELYGEVPSPLIPPRPENPKTLFNFWDIFSHPDKYQRNPYHDISPFLLLFFLLPLFSRKPQMLWLFGISVVFFLIIGFQAFLVRYALPVFPLFAVGAGIVISRLKIKYLFLACCLGMGAIILYFNYVEWLKLSYLKPKAFLIENKSRIEWLTLVGYNRRPKEAPYYIQYINDAISKGELEPEVTFLMVGECKGNLLDCRYLPDPGRWPVRWLEELYNSGLNYSLLKENFRKQNVTHLAVNKAYIRPYSTSVPKNQAPFFFSLYHLSLFLKKHTNIIYDKNEFILAEIIY